METNNRPLSLKYHAMDTEFPHGDTRIHPHSYPAKRLDCVYRPIRRLFAHTSQCTRSEISQICIQRRKSAIQSTAFRACDKPVVVYPDNDRGEDHGFTKGHNYSPVLGRLADKISEQTSTAEPNRVVTSPMQNPRAENKPRKIRVDTNKGFHFCGLPVQNPDKQGLPHTEENRANTTESNIISQFSGSPSKTMAISYRPTYGNREASPNGKNSHERFTVLSKTSVEADGNESQSVSSDRPPSTHRASVVVRYDKSHSGSPHAPSESGHSDFHGLLNGGLGSPYTEPGSVRGMVAQRENITHKQFRAKGSSSSSKTLGESCHWENNTCIASDNSTVVAYINKQGGTVSRSLCMEAKEMLIWCHQREIILRARYIPGKLNALADQLSRRGANSPHRVVPLSQDFQTVMQPVHQAHVGLVCNKIQQETGNLCISNAGPRIRSCRCPVTQLGEHVGLCISTNSPDSPDSDKDTDRGLSDHANSTRLRKGTVVPDTVKPNSGSPSGSATKQKSAKATKIKYLSQKPQISRSSRLDLIKRSIQAKGFSENTARCITKSVRGSTNAIYNSKWGIFEAWCCKRKIDPVKVSIHRIADFLTEKREGGLSATTIEGYRSAISNTLKHTSGLDLGLDSYISALLRSFRLEDTKRRNPSPPWDLSLVLAVLRSKPFEPIGSISMKNLTLKTVFLLALASGKRRSELHALSRAGVSWNKQKTRMTFRVTPSFVAKTQISTNVGAIHPFTINSLKDFVDDDKDEMGLCPVRALFEYMRRSEALGLTKDKKKLFVSLFKGKTTEISKPTISNWIKETIVTCYKLANNTQLEFTNVKAHQVRALAASFAFYHKVPLQEVLQAGTWRSHNTFVSFYLQDLSEENQEGYRLGPIIAGQSVVNI